MAEDSSPKGRRHRSEGLCEEELAEQIEEHTIQVEHVMSLEEKRHQFEHEALLNARNHVRAQVERSRHAVSRKTRLLQLMREKGGGNVRIAWRRFFDQDCDGELTFAEFCQGLVNIGYIGDVIALWRELGGDHANTITLHSVDRSGAEIVDYFANWCYDMFRGPWEFFNAIDDDGSNSLTAEEFVDGLLRNGFFNARDIPHKIASPEQVEKNLFPFLDADGQGAVSAMELSFLEKDEEKRGRIKQLQREKELLDKFGDLVRPLPRSAEELLRAAKCLGDASWQEELPAHRRIPRSRPASAPSKNRLSTPTSHRSATPKSPNSPAKLSAPRIMLRRSLWEAAMPTHCLEVVNPSSPSANALGSLSSFKRTRQRV